MGRITNDRTQGIVRVILAVIIITNAVLTAIGKNPITVDETSITAFIEYGAGIVAWAWSIWKNFNMTKASLKGQAVVEEEKNK